MKITTNIEEYFYDFFQEIHPFVPDEEIKLAEVDDQVRHQYELVHYVENEGNVFTNYVTISQFSADSGFTKKVRQSTLCRQDELTNREDKYIKRIAKLAIYKAMEEFFQISMPWGALTGVRPTKIAIEYYNENSDLNFVKDNLVNEYYLKQEKANLLVEILKNQLPIILDDKIVDFYVHIPFCTTRCTYCTFLSSEIGLAKKYVEPYIEALIEEINFAKQLIKTKGYQVQNVYVGGGTPTSLSAKQLDRILKEIDFKNIKEFTVEAGRPDTITKEKLDVLAVNGVTRISINPQTFNEQSLKAIGRSHSGQDILDAYKLARNYNFEINMDLIAGLPFDDDLFEQSLDKVISLKPDNITIHTLSFKTKSPLTKLGNYSSEVNQEIITKNVELAEKKLVQSNYQPYYLYRQKNMLGNLENVGYCKNNMKCQFNINSMEDFSSIIACGANAISKRIFFDENRIERQANVKDIITYINRIDDMMQKKSELFE